MSFTEAESTVISEDCTTKVWLRGILKKLGRNQNTTNIAQDGGATDWAERRPAKHFARRRQIDSEFSYIMRLIDDDEIKLEKVNPN